MTACQHVLHAESGLPTRRVRSLPTSRARPGIIVAMRPSWPVRFPLTRAKPGYAHPVSRPAEVLAHSLAAQGRALLTSQGTLIDLSSRRKNKVLKDRFGFLHSFQGSVEMRKCPGLLRKRTRQRIRTRSRPDHSLRPAPEPLVDDLRLRKLRNGGGRERGRDHGL